MSPNEGTNCLYGFPSQTHHCWGVGFHLCLLYALALSGGHPGEPWRSCSVRLPRLSRPLSAHLPYRFRHLLRYPATSGHRSLWSHSPNPLPESSAPPTRFGHHNRPHSQEELQRTSGRRKRRSSGTAKERAFFPETGRCVCVFLHKFVFRQLCILISTEIAVQGKRGAVLLSCTVPYDYYLIFVFWKVSSFFLRRMFHSTKCQFVGRRVCWYFPDAVQNSV